MWDPIPEVDVVCTVGQLLEGREPYEEAVGDPGFLCLDWVPGYPFLLLSLWQDAAGEPWAQLLWRGRRRNVRVFEDEELHLSYWGWRKLAGEKLGAPPRLADWAMAARVRSPANWA
jgi:hypothetical protein